MQPTPVFSPGESHGHRSLVGYSPCGPKESDTPEGQTVLGLPRCPGAFLPLSLAQEAFLFAAVPRLLALMACLVAGQGSGPVGSAFAARAGSSRSRDGTRIPCVGGWILIRQATRETR